MTTQKSSVMSYLFGLSFLLAIIVRFASIGMTPLNDSEAGWALQALQAAQGAHLWLGSQPAYIQLTSLLFSIFGSSTFFARLWPAFFGSLIVLIPILLRERLGRIQALVLAFVLALDPGLLAISHQAGSPVIAVAGGLLAVSCWVIDQPGWAGVFLGLGLLGGASFWPGLLGLAISLGLIRWMDRTHSIDLVSLVPHPQEEGLNTVSDLPESIEAKSAQTALPLRKLVIFTIGTILVVGALLFIRPFGLSGLAGGLTTYLSGWANPSGISSVQLMVALVAYEPLILILGIWGGVRGWTSDHLPDRFLSIWALVAFLLALVYPGRQVVDLEWTTIPLSVLAVREFLRHVNFPKETFINTISQAMMTFVVLGFVWLNLQGIVNAQTGLLSPQLAAIGIALAILLLASFLVGWGWSPAVVGRGLLWGLCSILFVYTLFAASGSGGLRANYTSELWVSGQSLPQVNLVVNTINELSDTHAGEKNNLDVVVVGIQSPGLQWALRDFHNVLFTPTLSAGSQPAIVITVKQTQPILAAAYRGDGFTLAQQPEWSLILPSEYLPWLVYHTAPQQTQSIILWARADLFPGGTLAPATNTTP